MVLTSDYPILHSRPRLKGKDTCHATFLGHTTPEPLRAQELGPRSVAMYALSEAPVLLPTSSYVQLAIFCAFAVWFMTLVIFTFVIAVPILAPILSHA